MTNGNPCGMKYDLLANSLRYPAGDVEMEELYTRTFDVQAIAYLDVGYVLFGEDYKRGHFLVKMQALQREYDNDCGTELPDHLPNILTLLPKMADQQEVEELVGKLVLPAIDKMTQGFKESENPYLEALRTVAEVLKEDYPRARILHEASTKTLDLPALQNYSNLEDA